MNSTSCVSPNIVTTLISNPQQRFDIFPRFFGPSPKVIATAKLLVCDYIRRLCPAFKGGIWDYYFVSSNTFFMVPCSLGQNVCDVTWENSHFQGRMSAEAAGIVACLFSFNDVAHLTGENRHIELFYNLFEFAQAHPENVSICAAVSSLDI